MSRVFYKQYGNAVRPIDSGGKWMTMYKNYEWNFLIILLFWSALSRNVASIALFVAIEKKNQRKII
jgi:hypothetical protein